MRESNSKNPKYFVGANIIALRKDSAWFDERKVANPNDEFLLESLDTLRNLESYGFRHIESQYFHIWISDKCRNSGES